jgi:hypothetical protein
MTGLEALQALREGKKVTTSDMKGSYYAYIIEFEEDGKPRREIQWVGTWDDEPYNPYKWCNGDPFHADYFLEDDWEVVE